MKRQFAKLSKTEQEKVEAEYHQMNPRDLDEVMAQAKKHRSEARLRSKRRNKSPEKKRAA